MRARIWMFVPAILTALTVASGANAAWTSRSGDLQNTANAGNQPGLTPENVRDLAITRIWQPIGDDGELDGATVNHTPVLIEGLLIFGDWMGRIYVVDTTRGSANPQDDILLRLLSGSGGNLDSVGKTGVALADEYTPVGHLGEELGNYVGVQSTPTVGMVTVPDGQGGEKEELRAYVGVNGLERGLYCLNLTKILADKAGLTRHDGTGYGCDGDWPRTLTPEGGSNKTMNGSPMLSEDQPWDFDGDGEIDGVRDILYTPSTGLDCADGRMWAMDPVTGEILWDFDPVTNSVIQGNTGGVIWTTPAMNRDRSLVYVTTGNCVGRPQVGEKAEAIVALDARSGEVVWWHQRRLIDTADLDIGVGPSVVDVDGYQGCHVVVSGDKDGCMYGYNQEADIPDIGEPGFDPLRIGQQRLLWRKCFAPGTLNGGFNSSNGAVYKNLFMQQSNVYPGGHNGADDTNAYAVDACTGKLEWASSDVGGGRTDAAIANDMLFQISAYRTIPGQKVGYRFFREVHVVSAESGINRVPDVLATVVLPTQGSLGGGGLAISDSKVYVPIVGGVAEVAVVEGSNASPPRRYDLNVFAGPYPSPIAPGGVDGAPTVNPDDPYPLMLENPNPTKIVESIQGFLEQQQREAGTLQGAIGETAGQ